MLQSSHPLPVYGIDTSSLGHIREVFETQDQLTIWTNVADLITTGRLKTVSFVMSEFSGWEEYAHLKPFRKQMVVDDKILIPIVSRLVRQYEGLLNTNRRANQADPWIIAMCLHYGCVPVANERMEHRRGRMSIAWVCQQEGLTPITLEELVAIEGLL